MNNIQRMYFVQMKVQMQVKVRKDFHGFVVVAIGVEIFSIQYFVLIVQFQDFYAFLKVHLFAVVF
jgi:hypothetical protein